MVYQPMPSIREEILQSVNHTQPLRKQTENPWEQQLLSTLKIFSILGRSKIPNVERCCKQSSTLQSKGLSLPPRKTKIQWHRLYTSQSTSRSGKSFPRGSSLPLFLPALTTR